ncbi:MAG: MFS transporter [Tenericutes bacterium]|nr:MFS transporter [Mycoplasmatota bacterium]
MKKITKKKMWVFALGQFGWAILGGIITNWLVYFYAPEQETINLGHKLYLTQGAVVFGVFTIVGLVTMGSRIFDAFTDPLIATVSDKSRHRLGRRIPFLRYAAFPFALVTVLVFVLPTDGISMLNNVWFTVMLLLFYLFMTMYCTPFNALIPELGKTQDDKINISTYISITFILGTALAYSSPFIWDMLIGSGIERMTAIRITFGMLAFIALLLMWVPAFFIKESDYTDTTPSNTDTFKSLTKTFKNKSFQTFVASDIFYWIALTLFQTGLPFFVTTLLGLEETMVTMYFLVMTVTSFLFYMPVNALAKKIGKKKLVVVGFSAFALVFAFSMFIGLYGFSVVAQGYIMAIAAAIPMAILGILPQAIVADIAQADALTTGENRGGMFYAARTFSFKLGQAVSMLIFTSLATIGAGSGLGYRVALGFAVLFTLIGALILTRYNEKKVLEILEVK